MDEAETIKGTKETRKKEGRRLKYETAEFQRVFTLVPKQTTSL
jgi:hypothetical protein